MLKIIIKKLNIINKSYGYITLISVFIVGSLGVAITLSLILIGIDSSNMSFAHQKSNQAKALANACTEEAMQQIRDSTPYTGSSTLNIGQGSCTYTVTSPGGQNRTITSTGAVANITRKVKVIINLINPTLQVVSWQEVGDF